VSDRNDTRDPRVAESQGLGLLSTSSRDDARDCLAHALGSTAAIRLPGVEHAVCGRRRLPILAGGLSDADC
jgi:hypothetical protein